MLIFIDSFTKNDFFLHVIIHLMNLPVNLSRYFTLFRWQQTRHFGISSLVWHDQWWLNRVGIRGINPTHDSFVILYYF